MAFLMIFLMIMQLEVSPSYASYPSGGSYVVTGSMSGLTFDYGTYKDYLQIAGSGTSPGTLTVTWGTALPATAQGFTVTFDGTSFASDGGYARVAHGTDGTYIWSQELFAVGSANSLTFNIRNSATNGAISYVYGNAFTYDTVTGTFSTTVQSKFEIIGSPSYLHKHWITLDTTAGSDSILIRFWTGTNSGPSTLGTSGTIRVVKSAACPSGGILSGGMCICTGPASVAWTDAVVTANSTKVRKIHIDELRAETDVRRVDAGLSSFAWTDATLTASTTKIRKVHIDELRSAIGQVYTACGQSAPTYTDPTITAGSTLIRATHITELRSAVSNAP